jgi:hypothetical protein
MSIQYEPQYRDFIGAKGVGENDVVASSVESYVSYLRSVSQILGVPISPELVNSEADVQRITAQLRGTRADNTINNYGSAMRQYVAMVKELALNVDPTSETSDGIEFFKCEKCGSGRLTVGGIGVRPEGDNFEEIAFYGIGREGQRIRFIACLDCGHIEMRLWAAPIQ